MWFTEPERFNADELAALVTHTTGGDLHIALAPQAVWRPAADQAELDRTVAELHARYAAEPADREEPDFATIAELLSKPPEARYGWITDKRNDTSLSVLVAGTSWFGLIAVRDGDDIWVRTFQPDRLSAVLAGVLPHDTEKPAASPIVVLRSEMLDAEKLAYDTVPRSEVRRAQRFAELTPQLSAEFNAETRDSSGRRQRGPIPLRVYDTEDGRWALRIKPHYTDERMELWPVGQAEFADLMDELRREITAQAW
ncbi:ESX secretion-associated protein EspG [Amycolatopsis sp.]|jgi:hypothetical protein|uniref:ESX secretion-associated protein EspG n=1 Tax=Amycolatopsis sp. TaxID=37632 RepID=UPI002E09EE38|nr:ESX secretion-associated protein EspG [Amycolatopsis sp.]